jgi:hypothetical protein
MSNFWSQTLKKVIRGNTRNQGENIWDVDANNAQEIDSIGHDYHDQGLADSISKCLNIDGWNEMLANLNMNAFKVVGVANATANNDAVNLAQLNTEKARIAALEAWKTGPTLINSLKSGGTIRHKSQPYAPSAAVTANATQFTRFTLTCNSAVALTITRPTSVDAELGEDYCVEGSILVTNGATPGPITLVGVNANNILGVQNLNPSKVYILTYCIHRGAGNSYKEVYSWAT